MENNPKKSKAFIVAFILILILLFVGYYLFKNRASIFDAKGSTTANKIFAPLLGTSKGKDLNVVDPNANVVTESENITGIVITDQLGNKIVRAQAGENLKKGDVLYISGFNVNKDPIVMKAISSDKNKSLVFGVAGEDILKGEMGNIIIEGILMGIATNRVEITAWMANNTLYLSDKVYGGMTKNAPFAPNFVINVGSVIKVDAVNGSIRIGGATNINTNLVNNSNKKTQNYFNSIFGANRNSGGSTKSGFVLNPINIPGKTNQNFNYPEVTVNADKTNIMSGESTVIKWTSKNTTSCDAGKGNSTKTEGSFATGKLTENKSYSIICGGVNGSRGGNITIYVTKPGTPPCSNGAYNPTACDNFTDPNAMTVKITSDAVDNKIKSGESTKIKWESINAESCKLYGGKLANLTGIENKVGVSTGILTMDTSYTIICTGKNKSNKSADVAVRVIQPTSCENGAYNFSVCDDFTDPNAMTVTVTPIRESILTGESTYITWQSANAISCDLSGGGLKASGKFNRAGVNTGKLTQNTSYTVVCTDKNKSTKSANTTVKVTVPEEKKGPVVTVTAVSPINAGKTSLITWTSANTYPNDKNPCYAREGGGTGQNGSFTTPILNASRSFTVYCTGPNGRASNDAFVTVNVVAPTIEEPKLPKPQCSDGIDNNNNNKIDADESNCHEGGVMSGTYLPTYNSESIPAPKPNTVITPNICLLIEQNPLTFTEEEKARLDVLLRKFYLVSSTLRTIEDITTINNEIAQNQNFISQIEALTKQCYEQITPSMIMIKTNNWARHGNPWYQKIAGKVPSGTYPYTDQTTGYLDDSQLEGFGTPAGYKVISGYYYGTLTKDAVIVHKTSNTVNFLSEIASIATFGIANETIDKFTGDKYTILGLEGENCDKFNKFTGYGQPAQINGNDPDIYKGVYLGKGSESWEANNGGFPGDSLVKYNKDNPENEPRNKVENRLPQKNILEAGCSWKDGVDLENTERILNIW